MVGYMGPKDAIRGHVGLISELRPKQKTCLENKKGQDMGFQRCDHKLFAKIKSTWKRVATFLSRGPGHSPFSTAIFHIKIYARFGFESRRM